MGVEGVLSGRRRSPSSRGRASSFRARSLEETGMSFCRHGGICWDENRCKRTRGDETRTPKDTSQGCMY